MSSPASEVPQGPQCSVIEDVMGVLGRAWAGAVLQAALRGAERFSEFLSLIHI